MSFSAVLAASNDRARFGEIDPSLPMCDELMNEPMASGAKQGHVTKTSFPTSHCMHQRNDMVGLEETFPQWPV
jgi:hypothetical protein